MGERLYTLDDERGPVTWQTPSARELADAEYSGIEHLAAFRLTINARRGLFAGTTIKIDSQRFSPLNGRYHLCVDPIQNEDGSMTLLLLPKAPIDKSEEADAKRFRWLLEGNGYFMEEQSLCGHAPTTEDERDRTRAEIDDQMS